MNQNEIKFIFDLGDSSAKNEESSHYFVHHNVFPKLCVLFFNATQIRIGWFLFCMQLTTTEACFKLQKGPYVT